jgi:hypothetical protein
MRKRKLYRYLQAQQEQSQSVVRVDHEASAFDSGVRYGFELAAQRHGQAIAAVRREALVAAQSDPHILMARRGGYEEGFAAGMRASQVATTGHQNFTYTDLENARRRGFEEGRNTVPVMGAGADVRRQVVEELLESARVIAESNPNMDPGSFLKAQQQRSKKIADK